MQGRAESRSRDQILLLALRSRGTVATSSKEGSLEGQGFGVRLEDRREEAGNT